MLVNLKNKFRGLIYRNLSLNNAKTGFSRRVATTLRVVSFVLYERFRLLDPVLGAETVPRQKHVIQHGFESCTQSDASGRERECEAGKNLAFAKKKKKKKKMIEKFGRGVSLSLWNSG